MFYLANVDNENEFKDQRSADLERFQNDLQIENNNYETLLNTHNDLIAALENEKNIIDSAINILESANVREYLYNRANQE